MGPKDFDDNCYEIPKKIIFSNNQNKITGYGMGPIKFRVRFRTVCLSFFT